MSKDRPHGFQDIDPRVCTQCGACVSVCPIEVIGTDGADVRLQGDCIDCGLCYRFCPGREMDFNALHAEDAALRTFLENQDPDWETTQTVAPEDVSAESLSDTTIRLTWTPVVYIADSGGYRVSYSTDPGGPYSLFSTTESKLVSQMEVCGLSVCPYCFRTHKMILSLLLEGIRKVSLLALGL